MTQPTAETFRYPNGSFGYRVFLGGVLKLQTKTGFLLEADARSCGDHIAADADLVSSL